jgi:hypothetical protein
MESRAAASFRINPDDLKKLIESCQYATDRLTQILFPVSLHGRIEQEWARDAVSIDVARYYDEQVFRGPINNYTALNDYLRELASTTQTLQRILADYEATDSTAADSMERL